LAGKQSEKFGGEIFPLFQNINTLLRTSVLPLFQNINIFLAGLCTSSVPKRTSSVPKHQNVSGGLGYFLCCKTSIFFWRPWALPLLQNINIHFLTLPLKVG
jgi:hypothetical protein